MGFLKDLAEAMDDAQDTTRKDSPYPRRPEDAFRKYLPGIRVHLLTKALKSIDDPEIRERYSEHRLQIFNSIAEHCLEARRLDEDGQIDEAIEFYEANVAYFDISDDAYERLRTIYCERGEYEDALRVCRAYLKMDEQYQQVERYPPAWRTEARQHFEEWCSKLEARVSQQSSE
jgi:tetratricopeptide (TPR) repeat protein